MKKVLIIGSCGAGKSTAAKSLAEIIHVPVIHLDAHYWKPGWVESEKDEWLKKVKELCARPQWIMDGNYSSTMDYRFEHADTVIFLLYPRLTCLKGIFKRLFTSQRVDDILGCKERIDWQFFHYVWTYNKIRAPEVLKKMDKLRNKKMHIVHGRSQLKNFFLKLEFGNKNYVQQSI